MSDRERRLALAVLLAARPPYIGVVWWLKALALLAAVIHTGCLAYLLARTVRGPGDPAGNTALDSHPAPAV
jgi:hypothetical protein